MNPHRQTKQTDGQSVPQLAVQPASGWDAAEQTALLRRYEPRLHFQKGERFFPTDVESFIHTSRLWSRKRSEQPVLAASAAQLSQGFPPRSVLSDDVLLYLTVGASTGKDIPVAPPGPTGLELSLGSSRRMPDGFIPRFLTTLFKVMLRLRPHTPSRIAFQRHSLYQAKMKRHEAYVYYGRVVEQGAVLILQYWYFYDFNDWRSWFGGANDHEGDWEMAAVYLQADPHGNLAPIGVAFSRHADFGETIYRPWDAPDLRLAGEHPVIFVSGGSHAGFFTPGPHYHAFTILGREVLTPFVDHAHGDGLVVGTQQERGWSPVLLDPLPDWLQAYTGYWGLFTGDPFGAENGIPGPMVARDGGYRLAWADPLAWAGLCSADQL